MEYQEQTYTGNVGGKALKTGGEGVLASVGGTAVVEASLLFFVYGSPIWVPYVAYAYYQHNNKIKEAAKGTQDNTTNTEAQPTDIMADTAAQLQNDASAQLPGPNPDTEIKPGDTLVATVSEPVEPPPAPTARPLDDCLYVD
jgi:hypothetical protein